MSLLTLPNPRPNTRRLQNPLHSPTNRRPLNGNGGRGMGFRDRSLGREIAVVLVIKVVAIAVIRGVFFGPDTRAAADPPALGAHILPASGAAR